MCVGRNGVHASPSKIKLLLLITIISPMETWLLVFNFEYNWGKGLKKKVKFSIMSWRTRRVRFYLFLNHTNIKPNIEPNIESNIDLNIKPIIDPNIELNIELNIEPNIRLNIETNIEPNIETQYWNPILNLT